MFGPAHYLPLLRWRRAERAALKHLADAEKVGLTPLIEIPPTEFGLHAEAGGWAVDKMLIKVVQQIDESWGLRPAFIDCGLIRDDMRASDGRHAVAALWEWAKLYGLNLVPVTGIGRSAEFQSAARAVAKAAQISMAIRLRASDLADDASSEHLLGLTDGLEQSIGNTDLVIDLGMAGPEMPTWQSIMNRLPSVNEWRTVTTLTGAFPKDLSGLSVGKHSLPRWDWIWWSEGASASKLLGSRLPTYGDYTIQHAYFADPPDTPNVSASIRYTGPEWWVVMRGEGLRTPGSPKHKQYPANAQLLIESEEFSGDDFSYGDSYIAKVATGASTKLGNPETWIRAGVNHHLTYVVRQLKAFWKSG